GHHPGVVAARIPHVPPGCGYGLLQRQVLGHGKPDTGVTAEFVVHCTPYGKVVAKTAERLLQPNSGACQGMVEHPFERLQCLERVARLHDGKGRYKTGILRTVSCDSFYPSG